jgi:branched-chain amino acid transport system substrate-binding protein
MVTSVFSAPAVGLGYPEIVDGVQARINQLNAAGGIDGRQVKLIVCNEQYNPDQAASCAREAVSDGVAAVIATSVLVDDDVTPILSAAGIPYLGSIGLPTTANTSSISFSFGGQYGPVQIGEAQALQSENCKKSGLLAADVPNGKAQAQFILRAATDLGVARPMALYVPETTADVSPQMAEFTSAGIDCVILAESPAIDLSAVRTLRSTAPQVKIIADAASLSGQPLQALGSQASGLLLVGPLLPDSGESSPAYADFNEWWNKLHTSNYKTVRAYLAWAAADLFIDAAEQTKDSTASQILAALPHLTSWNPGLFPEPLDFSTPTPVTGFTREFNLETVLTQQGTTPKVLSVFNTMALLKEVVG